MKIAIPEIKSSIVTRSAVDSGGYFIGTLSVQKIGEDILLPPNAVDLAPPAVNVWSDDYFYKLSEDKSQWVAEKKPTTAAECAQFGILRHEDESMRSKCLRSLFKLLVTADDKEYRIVRGEDQSWKVEKKPALTEEEIAKQELAEAKDERAEAVSKLIVEVNGMRFDADEESQTRMGRTIAAAVALGVDLDTEKRTWVLADNTIAEVTVKQLAEALRLAGDAQTELWTVPYEK